MTHLERDDFAKFMLLLLFHPHHKDCWVRIGIVEQIKILTQHC